MTRRQLTRHERDQRLRTMVVAGVLVALVLVVLVPAVGFYREVLTKGSQSIVTVGGESVVLDDYAKMYGFRSAMLDAQIGQLQQFAARQAAQTKDNSNPFAQQLQQLQQQRAE